MSAFAIILPCSSIGDLVRLIGFSNQRLLNGAGMSTSSPYSIALASASRPFSFCFIMTTGLRRNVKKHLFPFAFFPIWQSPIASKILDMLGVSTALLQTVIHGQIELPPLVNAWNREHFLSATVQG
jgi:hypothetical protein